MGVKGTYICRHHWFKGEFTLAYEVTLCWKAGIAPAHISPISPGEGWPLSSTLSPAREESTRTEHRQLSKFCVPECLSLWLQKFLLSAFLMVGNRNYSGCFKKKMYLLKTFGSLSPLKITESWRRSFQEKCPNIAELVWRWNHHGSYRALNARDHHLSCMDCCLW